MSQAWPCKHAHTCKHAHACMHKPRKQLEVSLPSIGPGKKRTTTPFVPPPPSPKQIFNVILFKGSLCLNDMVWAVSCKLNDIGKFFFSSYVLVFSKLWRGCVPTPLEIWNGVDVWLQIQIFIYLWIRVNWMQMQVRRGADRAEIYSLAFSSTAQWLAVSSDKGTVHVFNLKVNSGSSGNENSRTASDPNLAVSSSNSSLSFIRGKLPPPLNIWIFLICFLSALFEHST